MQELIHYAVNSRLGIIGCGLIFVVFFLYLTRSSYKIIGAVIALIIVVVLAREAVNQVERTTTAMVNNVSSTVASAIPDWIKKPFSWGISQLPSTPDLACSFADIEMACEILKKVKDQFDQVVSDQKQVEAICKDSPEVERLFGDAGKTNFCAGNPFKLAQRQIKAIAAGVMLGSISSISSFLLPDPPKLDTNEYMGCLYTKIKARTDVHTNSCTYTDAHKWRLCAEYHLQLPHEKFGGASASTPLDPDVLSCRKQAYNLK